MLYKNDEPYKLDAKEIEAVKKFFHKKFPVKVVYPPDKITPSRLPHNRLPDKPNSISFDLKSVVKTGKGAEVWRYADDLIVDNNGKKRYVPKKFRFNGSRYLRENDIELIYFLLTKSEYRLISEEELKDDPKMEQSRQPKFVFEDLVSEAEKKAEAKALESRITVLLYNKELCLPEEKIRLVAKAYHITGVDTLSLAQVKNLLDTKIHNKKFGGPERFFDMVDADEELEARASIQGLIDLKQIVYDAAKGAWFWNTEGETGKSIIVKVSKADIPVEVIYDLYKGDESFKDEIKALLISKGRKLKAKEKEKVEE